MINSHIGHKDEEYAIKRSIFKNNTSGGSRISRRGGRGPRRGGLWTPEAVTFQKFLYVKTKELGPLGGRAPGAPP